jgi:hypothetical protein
VTDPYALTTHDGKTVDEITHQALLECEKRLGYDLTIVQGSYQALDGKSNDVKASAGTHDGGGVVDLSPFDWRRKVRALREVGFAAWHRTPDQGPWGEHIHAVLIGNAKMAPSALRQVSDFLAHPPRDGLAGHAVDDTWHPSPPAVFQMPKPVVLTRGAGIDALIKQARERLALAKPDSLRARMLKASLASLLAIPQRPKR